MQGGLWTPGLSAHSVHDLCLGTVPLPCPSHHGAHWQFQKGTSRYAPITAGVLSPAMRGHAGGGAGAASKAVAGLRGFGSWPPSAQRSLWTRLRVYASPPGVLWGCSRPGRNTCLLLARRCPLLTGISPLGLQRGLYFPDSTSSFDHWHERCSSFCSGSLATFSDAMWPRPATPAR